VEKRRGIYVEKRRLYVEKEDRNSFKRKSYIEKYFDSIHDRRHSEWKIMCIVIVRTESKFGRQIKWDGPSVGTALRRIIFKW